MSEIVQDISGHNNRPGVIAFKQCYMASSVTRMAWEGAPQIMVVDGPFLKGHIFDQVAIHDVNRNDNNNQNL